MTTQVLTENCFCAWDSGLTSWYQIEECLGCLPYISAPTFGMSEATSSHCFYSFPRFSDLFASHLSSGLSSPSPYRDISFSDVFSSASGSPVHPYLHTIKYPSQPQVPPPIPSTSFLLCHSHASWKNCLNSSWFQLSYFPHIPQVNY